MRHLSARRAIAIVAAGTAVFGTAFTATASAACPVGTQGVSGTAAVGPCYSLVGNCATVRVYYDLIGTHGDPSVETCP